MTVTKKEFNALASLKGIDFSAQREFVPALNGLTVGAQYHFYEPETTITRKWKRIDIECTETDNGVVCIPEWLGACVENNESIFMNKEEDVKFHCVLQKWTKVKDIVCLADYLTDDSTNFPPIIVKAMLPIAIRRAEVLATNKLEVLNAYKKELGVELKDITMEWIPSIRELQDGVTGKKFIRRSLTAVFEKI